MAERTAGPRLEDARVERDVLVLAKTVAANEFPVESPSVLGVDRETGRLLRLSPFPWSGGDTEPPVPRWSWIHLRTAPAELDPRPESRRLEGEVITTAYVDAKDAWRLRWPFVRAQLHGSLEALRDLARSGAASAGFVRPAPDADVLQLPLRLRFRCASEDCADHHELPVLDWELHAMSRAARERYGPQWATRFRETWGGPLFERYDVHVLVSAYAQSPARFHVAGLFYPPRRAEDAHDHLHHAEHRRHLREAARGG
ncbi:MAG: hypothetical protein ACRDF0_07535 [Candidatus Limnocylindria bacterium]